MLWIRLLIGYFSDLYIRNLRKLTAIFPRVHKSYSLMQPSTSSSLRVLYRLNHIVRKKSPLLMWFLLFSVNLCDSVVIVHKVRRKIVLAKINNIPLLKKHFKYSGLLQLKLSFLSNCIFYIIGLLRMEIIFFISTAFIDDSLFRCDWLWIYVYIECE